MTDAVLESHRRALALAQQATTARVCALERYAAQVRVTDALTGQASAADEALREGLHRAAIAAEALVLPVDDEP